MVAMPVLVAMVAMPVLVAMPRPLSPGLPPSAIAAGQARRS